MFWYVMLAAVWILQGLMYGSWMLYLMLGGSVGNQYL
jgi:undecaprenyl-diphosphatase